MMEDVEADKLNADVAIQRIVFDPGCDEVLRCCLILPISLGGANLTKVLATPSLFFGLDTDSTTTAVHRDVDADGAPRQICMGLKGDGDGYDEH